MQVKKETETETDVDEKRRLKLKKFIRDLWPGWMK